MTNTNQTTTENTPQDTHCIQSMTFRPSGDMSGQFDKNNIMVLETNLEIGPDNECNDVRLGDLLVSLEDMINMGPSRKDVDCVEILCMPGKSVDFTYRPMR
jgi:hypothetical protein